jgi:hypothetical protein
VVLAAEVVLNAAAAACGRALASFFDCKLLFRRKESV